MESNIEIKKEIFEEYGKETFFKTQNNNYSISSGVNQFDIPKLYKKINSADIDENENTTSYAAPRGNAMLIKAIVYYEKFFSQSDEMINEKNVCLVAGGTAGLNFVFEYLAVNNKKKAVAIGYSYTLFKLLANRFGIELVVLKNEKEQCKISPDIDDIIKYIQVFNPDFICLTDPANPSGEMISEDDFRKLIRMCKNKGVILLIDKCQRDELELFGREDYFSINNVISEEKADNNTVIINSYSKIRSLPGARVGYVVGNEKMIRYIEYLNTITYWHCNATYTEAIVVDLMYQLVYLENDDELQKKIIRDYTKIIVSYLPTKSSIKKIMQYINHREVREKAKIFCEAIKENYKKIERNYKKSVEIAKKNNLLITERKGGYNFCIKRKNIELTQGQLKQIMSERYSIEIFTQEDFCDKESREYWIRISCAKEEKEFIKIFNKLVDFLCDKTNKSIGKEKEASK